jgi:hypothetical protein
MVLTTTTLRDANRPLTLTAGLMLAAFGVAIIGLAVDPRIITGAPAWLKPAKFAISTAIYSLSLAWVFTYLPEWRRTRAFVGWTTAIVFIFEVLVIDVQAWRGTTSHFNVATPLDAVLFSSMGAAILFQTISSVWVAVALFRQRFDDEVLGWALRLGMAVTIAGALSGGLMTRPTAAQLAAARETHMMTTAGAHTVGAPDGGPGLLGTGWSRTHGDLRIGHFLGLHALQILPLLTFAARRRRSVIAAGACYAALFMLLIWQALRGEALLDPGALTSAVVAIWAIATIAAFGLPARWLRTHNRPATNQRTEDREARAQHGATEQRRTEFRGTYSSPLLSFPVLNPFLRPLRLRHKMRPKGGVQC